MSGNNQRDKLHEAGYLTTRDICKKFDVSTSAVYGWFRSGRVVSQKVLPESSPGKRSVGRHVVTQQEIEQLERYFKDLQPSFIRYLPRELGRRGIR